MKKTDNDIRFIQAITFGETMNVEEQNADMGPESIPATNETMRLKRISKMTRA